MTNSLKVGEQTDSQFIYAAQDLAIKTKLGQVNAASDALNKMLFDNGPSNIHKFGQLFSVSHASSDVRIENVRIATNLPVQDVQDSCHLEVSQESSLYEDGQMELAKEPMLPSAGQKSILAKDSEGNAIPTKLATSEDYSLALSDEHLLLSNEDLVLRDETIVHIENKTSGSAILGLLEGIPVIGSAVAVITTIGHLFGMLKSYIGLKIAASRLLKQDPNIDAPTLKKAATVFKHAMNYTIHRNYITGSLLSVVGLKPIKRLLQLCGSAPKPETAAPIEQEKPHSQEYLLSSCN